jgi:hypothetical protein
MALVALFAAFFGLLRLSARSHFRATSMVLPDADTVLRFNRFGHPALGLATLGLATGLAVLAATMTRGPARRFLVVFALVGHSSAACYGAAGRWLPRDRSNNPDVALFSLHERYIGAVCGCVPDPVWHRILYDNTFRDVKGSVPLMNYGPSLVALFEVVHGLPVLLFAGLAGLLSLAIEWQRSGPEPATEKP